MIAPAVGGAVGPLSAEGLHAVLTHTFTPDAAQRKVRGTHSPSSCRPFRSGTVWPGLRSSVDCSPPVRPCVHEQSCLASVLWCSCRVRYHAMWRGRSLLFARSIALCLRSFSRGVCSLACWGKLFEKQDRIIIIFSRRPPTGALPALALAPRLSTRQVLSSRAGQKKFRGFVFTIPSTGPLLVFVVIRRGLPLPFVLSNHCGFRYT